MARARAWAVRPRCPARRPDTCRYAGGSYISASSDSSALCSSSSSSCCARALACAADAASESADECNVPTAS
eukprot:6175355-Pleurochrysis_carterae.AAC.2